MPKEDKFISIRCEGSSTADLDDLIPFQGDLKELTPKALRKLESVLIRHGFSEPVSVWQSDNKLFILNGHQRVTALKSLRSKGYDIPKIPIVRIEAADRKEAKEKVLALTAQYGALSPKSVSDFMIDAGLSLEFLEENIRFPEVDFDKISLGQSQQSGSGSEDEIPQPMPTAFVKRGEVYILGNHRLMCGDSTMIDDVERLMNGEKADMVFTDPPYGIGFRYNSHQDSTGDEYMDFCRDWFNNLKQFSQFIVISTGWAYNKFWYSYDPQDCFYWICRNKRTGGSISHFRKIEPIFIWGKPVKKYDFDFWEQTTQIEKELKGKHTCPKPVGLIEAILEGVKDDGLVLDVFGGSGTTLIAAEKTKRTARLIEIDPFYCGVILDRWQAFTGKKAHREDGVSWDSIKGE